MADLSIREKIFEAIVNVLKSVPGMGAVGRGKIDALEAQHAFTAFVSPGTDTVIEYLGDRIDRQLIVFTFLWVKSQSDVLIEAEAFLPKVQKALAEQGEPELRLGGLVNDITETSVHEPFPMADELTEAGVILEHAVLYRVSRLDPYSQI